MLSNKSKVERRRPIYPCTQLVGGILVTRGAENNLVLEMTQQEGEIILKMIKQQDEMEEERMMKQQNEKVEDEDEEMIWDAVNFALAQLDLDSSSQESEESDDLRDLICGEVPTMRNFGEERLIPELDFSYDRNSSCPKTNFNDPNVKEVKVSPMSNQVNNKCLKSSRVYGHHQGVGSILRSSYNLNHMESKSSMKPDDCGRAYQHQHGQLQQLLRRPIKSSKKPGHSCQQELLGGPIKLEDTQQQLGRPIEKVCQERHKRYM